MKTRSPLHFVQVRNWFFVIGMVVLGAISCAEKEVKNFSKENMVGTWLVIYPDDQNMRLIHKNLFKKVKDTLLQTYALRLIQFQENEQFNLIDSLPHLKGKWYISEGNQQLNIRNGGSAWQKSTLVFREMKNETLICDENLKVGTQSLTVGWKMRKLPPSPQLDTLVGSATNQWRTPLKPEADEKEVATFLKNVLLYHAVYFETIASQTNFFIPDRVPLPFRYFSGGIALKKEFDSPALPYYLREESQRLMAKELLNMAFDRAKVRGYPSRENFVLEYAVIFRRMAEYL